MLTSVLATIVEGPSNVTYIPGLTPLPIELVCNCTGAMFWEVDGKIYLLSFLTDGALPGHSRTGSNILVNSPVNNTKYICISPAYDPATAYIVIAGKTFMYISIYGNSLYKFIIRTLRGQDQREVYFYFHIVHFKGTSVLYLPNLQKIQQGRVGLLITKRWLSWRLI